MMILKTSRCNEFGPTLKIPQYFAFFFFCLKSKVSVFFFVGLLIFRKVAKNVKKERFDQTIVCTNTCTGEVVNGVYVLDEDDVNSFTLAFTRSFRKKDFISSRPN